MLREIWASFRNLPLWVQLWVSFVLVPVNLMPLAFVGHPQGVLIAALAISGMVLNLPIMVAARGLSRAMALPHILCWGPMVVIVAHMLVSGVALQPVYAGILLVLLIIDVISLAFDLRDAALWFRGEAA